MCDNCKCKNLLKRKDIAPTKLRRLTIKTLTLANKSLTPPEILKEIRKFQSINKVTLYRILDLLETKEIVRKILTSDDVSRYELSFGDENNSCSTWGKFDNWAACFSRSL